MPDQCYFNGEFWQCKAPTNPGETPATHPAKWSRLQIPKEFRAVLARYTYAFLLELDGQKDKSSAELGQTEPMLNDLVRREANREHWRQRPSVQTPGRLPGAY